MQVFKNNKDLQPEAINIADEFNTKVELKSSAGKSLKLTSSTYSGE